jgi:hypothetical protein
VIYVRALPPHPGGLMGALPPHQHQILLDLFLAFANDFGATTKTFLIL